MSQQLAAKTERCAALLPTVDDASWLPPVPGGIIEFRNRAKLAVGGRAGAVTLGILDADGEGVDLTECLIHEDVIYLAIPMLAAFLNDTGLEPYSVPRRRGELKYVHVTASPGGSIMVRFVVRSDTALELLSARVIELERALPHASVISVNILPEHKAVLEGDREVLLVGSSLPMHLGPVTLHLRPQSFFQTNTTVARALYEQAAAWVADVQPESLWDLYCGVGGFALFASGGAAHEGERSLTRTVGVEMSEQAIESARRSALDAGLPATFVAGDATAFALGASRDELPDLVVVNPPRRGIGDALAEWIEDSTIPNVIYSSCNPASLASDLARMPSLRVRAARLFDMFPHTSHLEVAVLLERAS